MSKPQASAGRPQASPFAGRLRPAATVSKYRFGIGTENLQPYRLIANLFQRILDQRIMLMAEELEEEYVGPLATARGTGLDARQVHAVVVERLQQMMQRARTVAHGHNHRGLVIAGRRHFLIADDQETRGVVRAVLDLLGNPGQPV